MSAMTTPRMSGDESPEAAPVPRTPAQNRRARAVRWSAYGALAVVFAIVCVFLSDWQFSRNAERSVQLDLVASNYERSPVPLDEVIGQDGAFDPADEWRPVTLRGEYMHDDQVLVRNRAHGGSSAYEVLEPFRLDDGRVLIVNRGWLPPGRTQPLPDAIPAPPAGPVQVEVRLRPSEPLPPSGRSAPEGQVPTIHLPAVAEITGPDTIASAYGLLVSESVEAERARIPDPPSADPGPHLSYAIQWILFAIMGFIFIGYVIRSEIRNNREDAADAAAAAAARAASGEPEPVTPTRALPNMRRQKRRRDRDSVDEDAILDAHEQ
ncbi:MAG TPA: SURF1 family protein [Microbacteriaceae bacterium]|nr:SURF1 family protein [Microbacteriaceae bacterium]